MEGDRNIMTIEYLDSKRIIGLQEDRIGATASQGNNGGAGLGGGNTNTGGGGGGGAGAAGVNAANSAGGNGGAGLQSDITGTNTYYAGGGGGGTWANISGDPNGGTGGTGGGGNGGEHYDNPSTQTAGTANTGGGGGAAGITDGTVKAGGSGVVILQFTTSGTSYSTTGSPTVDTSSVSNKTVLKYTGSGTFVLSSGSPDVRYLVVGGGGGGAGGAGGGGGAGGFLTGTKSSLASGTYTVTIGAGGAGRTSGLHGSNGANSSFAGIVASGGGGGAENSSSAPAGADGGSGGGGGGRHGGDGGSTFDGTTVSVTIPTDVQDNSLLIEKDTANRYWFDDEFSKSNCKAYFTLDETSGNPANHATSANGFSDGNGINGTNGSTGATQNITGKFDKCFEFSGGNNEQVDMGNTILSGTTDFTLSGWINSSITSSGTYVIFNSYLGSATAGIQLYVNGSGNIIYWTSTGSITTSTATSGSNNSWDHVVVTKEGTSVKIYLNGAVDVSGTINHSITGGNFSIGGRSDGLYCFKGKIDEASVWTRALSASEVSELYNSGTGKTLLEAKTATWTMEPTFRDDFSTDNWDNMSSRINVNTTTEKLDFAMYRDGDNDSAVYDLGAGNVSDTAWVLRWKMNFTAVYASGNGNRLWFGLSSLPQTTNQDTNQDSIMMYQNHDGTDCFSTIYTNNGALPQTNTKNPDYATGTDYYCELKRTSSTTIESRMWTGGYGGTLLSNAEDSVSNSAIGSVTDLRYIKMSNIFASQGGSVITGTIDDLEFYNGVTSVN